MSDEYALQEIESQLVGELLDEELLAIRQQAQALGPAAWVGSVPKLNTELALATVLASARPRPHRLTRFLHLTSSAAAALLVATLAAPYLLQMRVERSDHGPLTQQMLPVAAVFWTSGSLLDAGSK